TVNRVDLTGNASAGLSAGVQGWLLASWFASRLGWTRAERRSGRLLALASPGGEVAVSWEAVNRDDLPPGRLAGLELGFTGGERLNVSAQPGSPYLVFDEAPRGLAWREPGIVESLDRLLGGAFTAEPNGEWLRVIEQARAWDTGRQGQ
ncbi:MAG TPA: hypothetical protein VHN99_01835, partial [Deinococcales bacterium]|nr:hypothetical protein [Deinococcales bacterium]